VFRRRYSIPLAFGFIALLALGAVFWAPVQQARAVSELQKCARLVMFEAGGVRSGRRPARLPVSVDAMAKDLITRFKAKGKPGLSSYSYLECFRSCFFDPIDKVNLMLSFNGDAGAALTRLPQLRELRVMDMNKGTSEMEWTRLCRELRACKRLEKIDFKGEGLTDAALSQLKGHPSLREVTLWTDHLTPECAATFATMPLLKKLGILSRGPVSGRSENLAATKAALPGVNVFWVNLRE
jgi:hypothetical protein